MFRNILLILAFLVALPAVAQKKAPKPSKYDTLVTLSTQFGDIKMLLYEDTPLHRANFLKLVGEKFYDGLLFHRVIQGFMIQGGDPNSRNAQPDQRLGAGGGDMKRIPAEFRPNRHHKKGVIAAARDNNPAKASSACQFYLVQGKPLGEGELQSFATTRKYTNEQVQDYKTIGGTPSLDMGYTVFGEIIEGIDVIDKIASQPTKPDDRPVKDVQMSISYQKMKKTDITKKYKYVYPENVKPTSPKKEKKDKK
jgi:peptidyl-prolyl cis-trans isomerase B (cyclophilin B)